MWLRSRRDRSLRQGLGGWPWFACVIVAQEPVSVFRVSRAGFRSSLRSPALFPTMPDVDKKPDGGEKSGGGLHNTIYEQQTRSGRRLTLGRRLLYQSIAPVGLSLVHLVWRWSRGGSGVGAEHIHEPLTAAPAFHPATS